MEQNVAIPIVAAVLGGFLAAGTGWLLQWDLERRRSTKTLELLKTSICDDLSHSLELYDKIEDEWEKGNIVWFTTVSGLRQSRLRYEKNEHWIVLLRDSKLRQRIFRYYLRSGELLGTLEYQQNRKHELDVMFYRLADDIRARDSQMDSNRALEVAHAWRTTEATELSRIPDILHQAVSKCSKFKAEADVLLSELGGKHDN